MKITEQSATLRAYTRMVDPDEPGEAIIEEAGRTCTRTPMGDRKRFIQARKKQGHLSIFRHFSATVRLVTSIAIASELNRHRHFSPSQSSTRYIAHAKGVDFVKPETKTAEGERIWAEAARVSEYAYLAMLEAGEPPEVARDVLLLSTAATITGSANLHGWMDIFRARMAPAAHPKMRQLMALVLGEVKKAAPISLEDVKP